MARIRRFDFNKYEFEDDTYLTFGPYWKKEPYSVGERIPDVPPSLSQGFGQQTIIACLDSNGNYIGMTGTKIDKYGNIWSQSGKTITITSPEGYSYSWVLDSEYPILELNYKIHYDYENPVDDEYPIVYDGLQISQHGYGLSTSLNFRRQTEDKTSETDENTLIELLLGNAEIWWESGTTGEWCFVSGILNGGFPVVYGLYTFKASSLYNPNDVYSNALHNFYYGERSFVLKEYITGFIDPIDVLPSDDPYNEGGTTDTGGGGGTFDGSTDNIDFPPLPTINALSTGFVSMWRPTILQLNDLYNYMWTGAFDVDTFKKIFANPIDCILGFAICPLNPAISGASEFKVGNIGTGILIDKVSEQYYYIDCGYIELEKQFGSYLDFEPYTTIDLYLPYIGSVRISTDDIRKNLNPSTQYSGKIHIKYMVDILSGSCVAFLKCNDSVCYQFNGSVLTQIPITGNDYTSMYQSIVSLAGNVISGITSGVSGNAGAILGNMANVAGNVMGAKPTLNRSGNITSSSGFMAEQKPALIFNMPIQAVAWAQNVYEGYPSHITQGIASLQGYTEFEKVYIDNVPATESELNEIKNILETGVFL